jgi:hypothetical protein
VPGIDDLCKAGFIGAVGREKAGDDEDITLHFIGESVW